MSLLLVGSWAAYKCDYQRPTQRKHAEALRQAGAYTIGDILEWNVELNSYASTSTAAAKAVTLACCKGWLYWMDSFTKAMLNLARAPRTGPPFLLLAKLRLSSVKLNEYRPRVGREILLGESELPRRLRPWGIAASSDDAEAAKMDWKMVFSSSIVPEEQSLLWLMQYGTVTTGSLAKHWQPGDGRCVYCHRVEMLARTFYACPCVREFWRLISEFPNRITTCTEDDLAPVSLSDVVGELTRWK
jgi:hypothetical protein